MTHPKNLIAAIDIGTTKIVTVLGRINEKQKVEILGLSKTESTGVRRGVVLNIEETVNAIKKTVEEVRAATGEDFTNVYVGIAGQHIKSVRNRTHIHRDSYDDEITQEDVDALIADMYKLNIDIGEEIIHVLPQNFVVDSETGVKNPVGMFGRRLEGNFHIVIGQITSARNIEKCVSRVGFKVNSLVLEPLASAKAVLTEDEKEAGVALVDIGGGTTDVAVYYDGVIRHTAVIPFGGFVVTQDIKEGCSILMRQAELLKVQYGSALGDIANDDKVVTIPGISGREPKEISFKNLAYIIQSRMEEIIDAVTFEIESSGYLDKLSAGIVITGGGALLRHLSQLVRFRTGMDVRIGFPGEHISGEMSEEINQPMYATSIGLILKGYEMDQAAVMDSGEEKKNDDEIVDSEPKNEHEVKADEKEEKKKNKQKTGIFDTLKKTITDIFEENDAQI